MNKKIVILISVCIFLILFLYAIFNSKFLKSSVQKPYILPPVSSVSSTPTPPLYSVEILSVSKGDLGFIGKANVTNVSIKPYITNIGIDTCTFIDENGKESKVGAIDLNTLSLEKAILPNNSQVVDFRGNIRWSYQKCSFQTDGTKTCPLITITKIKDCTFGVTSDGKQASNGWGKYPVKASF